MPTSARTAVVAVGGNALLDGGGPATIAEQFDAARGSRRELCRLVADGWRIVLTHGNGPQVGFIMRRSDLVADIEPGLPQLDLDMAVADSQGSLGYILGATLQGELRASGLDQQVVATLTHTVVDPGDPAFARADEADRELLRGGRRAPPGRGERVGGGRGLGPRLAAARRVAAAGADRRAGRDPDAGRRGLPRRSPRAAAGSRSSSGPTGGSRASRP